MGFNYAAILAPAVFSGLIFHAYYKRHEPTIFDFGRNFILLCVLFTGWTFVDQPIFHPQSILGRVMLFNLVHLFSLGLSISVYRLFFHSLRKYPGPFFAKLTKLEGVYHALPGLFHDHMTDIHNKYGDIVRIGPNELSFRHAGAVQPLLGKVNKGPYFETSTYTDGAGMPLNALVDYDAHKARRKLWDAGFSQKSLKSFGPLFNRHLDELCTELGKREGQVLDFVNWCDYYAFDVMGGLAFNKDFGLLTGKGTREYSSFIRSGIKTYYIVANIPWISPLLSWIPLPKEMKQQSMKFLQLGSKQYEERRIQGTDPHDLFSYLIESYTKQDKESAEANLRADSPVLFIAGSDTTSTSMAFLFYFICRDRPVYKRLREEIDNAWDGKSLLEAGMIGAGTCPYLHGAIQEALRLVPPAPNGMQRINFKGFEVDGNYVPPGTISSVNAWVTQRDPRNFSNPLEFVPERWIDSERIPEWNHVPIAFLPFGLGSYVCIGRTLAMQELRLIAVRLIKQFDFELAPNFNHDKFWGELRSWQAIFKPELPMVYRKRDSVD